MSKLDLGLDSDDSSNDKLNINKAYAERYDNWRRLEELQKLKNKYGNDVESNSDSDSSSSEEPAIWSAENEKDFLRTLSALKSHDPRIYSDEKFFTAKVDEPSTSSTGKKVNKNAAMFLKDYERKLVLEKGGDISENDEKEEAKTFQPGYHEKQELIKRELKAVLASQNDDDEDAEPLLRQRVKTNEEMKKEEDAYYEWLKGQKDEDLPGTEELNGLREAWNDANLEEGEKFLRDYLLNKQYDVDGGESIPSYEEIVNIEKDEEELERENEFERKYNFRYEEPDQDFIKQYPRTIKQSLRKKNEGRKQKRDAYKERKKLEKQARKDEIKELKTLKKKEIEEKLQRLKKLAGDEDLPLNVDDLEADFDPAAYDKRMKEVFNSQYYEKPTEEDEEKPVFSDVSDDCSDESDYDNFDVSKERSESENEHSEGHSNWEKLNSEKKPSRRKRKRNSRFIEALLKKKPLFDPVEKTFEEYFNEYYALDYEDIIADGLITKFKYRDVPANDFGITIDELLNADDRQLNAWASLKKATAYRSEAEELYDIKAYKKKALNTEKKKRIFTTDFGGKKSRNLAKDAELADGMDHVKQMDMSVARKRKRSKKSKRKLLKDACTTDQQEKSGIVVENEASALSQSKLTDKRRKKNRGAFKQFSSAVGIDDDRLLAYGVNPKKYKNRLFHQQQNRADDGNTNCRW